MAASSNGSGAAHSHRRDRELRQQPYSHPATEEVGLPPRSSSRGHKERMQQYSMRPTSGSLSQPQLQPPAPAPERHHPSPVYVSPAVAAAAVSDRIDSPAPPLPPRMGSATSSAGSIGSRDGSASGHHSGGLGAGVAPRSSHHSSHQQPAHIRRAHQNGVGVSVTPLATDMGSVASEPASLSMANGKGSTSRQSGGRNTPR